MFLCYICLIITDIIWLIKYLVTGVYARHAPTGVGVPLLTSGASGLNSTIARELVALGAVSTVATCKAWLLVPIGINDSDKG